MGSVTIFYIFRACLLQGFLLPNFILAADKQGVFVALNVLYMGIIYGYHIAYICVSSGCFSGAGLHIDVFSRFLPVNA